MKKRFIITIIATVFVVSGCDHYSTKMAEADAMPHNISQISPASGGDNAKPSSFSDFLAREYYVLAQHEQDVTRDYPAAKKYFTKAEKLSSGEMVSLNRIRNYRIEDKALKAELRQAREEITNALEVYRLPENRWALAVAHSRFDCWLDEAEEGKEMTACKAYFKEAMNSLVVPPPIVKKAPEYYTENDFEGNVGFE